VLQNVVRVAHEHVSRHDTCSSSNAGSFTKAAMLEVTLASRERCGTSRRTDAYTRGASVPSDRPMIGDLDEN
jgi:hypothetical protein